MNKKLLVLLLTLVIGSVGISNSFCDEEPQMSIQYEVVETQEQKDTRIFKEIEKRSVSIINYGAGVSSCTGVLIGEVDNKSYVLSAKHCLDARTEEMKVENNNVLFIVPSTNEDLVYIVVDGKIPNKIVAEFADQDSVIGDQIYHVGYPNWLPFLSTGIILKENKDHKYALLKVVKGCSGGGLFNENYELIGTVWGGLELPNHGNFDPRFENVPISVYEPISDVKKFLGTIE